MKTKHLCVDSVCADVFDPYGGTRMTYVLYRLDPFAAVSIRRSFRDPRRYEVEYAYKECAPRDRCEFVMDDYGSLVYVGEAS